MSFFKWLVKLLGGWLPIGEKPFGEWLGKIIWVVGIVSLCLFAWTKIGSSKGIIRTGTQKAQEITNVYHNETLNPRFGCANLRVIEFYRRKQETK